MAQNKSDYNSLSLEERRSLAKEYNQGPTAYPDRTQPVSSAPVPDIGITPAPDVVDMPEPIPDYETRLKNSERELPKIKNEVIRLTRGSYSKEMSASNPYADVQAGKPKYDLNPYGTPVNIQETHEMDRKGVWRSRYPYYKPGLDNDDYFARRQGAFDKAWKGVGKLVSKSLIYGVSGTIMIPDKLMAIAREGSLKAALSTDTDKFFDDLDAMVDRTFVHYYRKETKDYNIGQKLLHDTGNFIWNDVIGSGMSFTVGAMLTAYATGGMGLASLGNVGARAGLSIGRGLAVREAQRRGVGALKSIFNQYARKGVATGRKVGNIAQNIGVLATSAGYESAFEARQYINESEKDFKNYYRNTHNREPSYEELTEFRELNNSVAGGIFAANMGIVGLSNWVLFGKYVGVGGKVLPKASDWTNKKIFGLGTEVVKPGEMAIKITNPNIGQRIAANTFNITKRPLSEGLWEEGTQGVAQNAAEEYVKSRYDEVSMKKVAGVLEAIGHGFEKQYTTKEGWTEIGIGAIIGTMFGARSGAFGIKEYSNSRIRLQANVEAYNKQVSNLNTAALNTLKQAINLGPQIKTDASNTTDEDFDEAIFAKMSVENELGLLDDSADNFRQMIDQISLEEIMEANNMTTEQAKDYKETLIQDYNKRLEDFKIAADFADNTIGDESAIEFKRYVSHNVFLGLQAAERMRDISQVIEDLSDQPDVSASLNLFSRTSEKAIAAAKELSSLKSEVEALEKEIEDIATRPRNVDGVDPQAEEIQKKTQRLNQLQEEYTKATTELAYLSSKEFSVLDLRRSTDAVIDSGFLPVSTQDLVAAYEVLRGFDDFLNSKKGSELTVKERGIRKVVEAYRTNLVRYRNMNDFLSKMSDPRFMRKQQRGLSKLLMDMVSPPHMRKTETPDFIDPGQLPQYASDEVVDNALKEGRISEDEAFTIKAFMHSLDQVRKTEETEDIPQREIEETITDEEYEAVANDDAILTRILRSIVNKVRNGQEDILTPREREIYDNNRDRADSYMTGDSPIALLDRLNKKVKRIIDSGSAYDQNNFIIDLVREKLDGTDRAALDNAIDEYKRLQNDFEDGKTVDQDELLGHMITISELGQVGNIADLLPYIDQNRLIERGGLSTGTVTELSNEEQAESATNEYDSGAQSPGANIDSLQNPEILMVRKTTTKAGQKYEISGLQLDKFIGRLKFVTGVTISSKKKKTKGLLQYEIKIGNESVYLQELPYHARFEMSEESAAVLNRYSNVQIRDVSNAYSIIWDVSDPYAPTPFRTEVGYGANETEKIDQQALSEIKVGDEVDLVIDINDTYNQTLINDYDAAVETGKESKIQKATKKLISDLVIKVMKDGKLVSVVKSVYNHDIPSIYNLRLEAVDKLLSAPADATEIAVGKRQVIQTLPGRPMLNLADSQNGGAIESIPITEKGAEKVVNVGYILDGKVNLKEEGDYSLFPFSSVFTRNEKGKYTGKRIPVVVIKAANGINYVYPVSLRESENEEAQWNIELIDEMLDPYYDMSNADQSTIQEINRYLTSIGLNPAEYQISYVDARPGLEKARQAIAENGNVPDVSAWVSGSRSIQDIATNDVKINVDLESEVFVAPKIRIRSENESIIEDQIDDEIPFTDNTNEGGSDTASEEESSSTDTESEEESSDTGTDTQPTGQPVTPPDAPAKPETRERFGNKIKQIESRNAETGKPPYVNAYDFIARKIASGSLKFLVNKKNANDIRREIGIDPSSRELEYITAFDGLTLDQYVDWVRNQTEDVMVQYASTRSDRQIKEELKVFLGYINYRPTAAINYSLIMNGLNHLMYKDGKAVSVLEEGIARIVLEEAEGVASALTDITEDASTDSDVLEEEEENADNESHQGTSEQETETSEQETGTPGQETGVSETEGSETSESSSQAPEPKKKAVKPKKPKVKRKPKKVGPENIIETIREINNSLPEGERMTEQEFMQFIEDIKSVYDADTSGMFGMDYFMKEYNKLIESNKDGRTEQEGVDVRDTKTGSRPSTEEGEGQPGTNEPAPGDGGISGSDAGTAQPAVAQPDGPHIKEEPGIVVKTAQVSDFLYVGDESYANVPGKVSEIPRSRMVKIKKGDAVASLLKGKFKRAGGNWLYTFDMHTGEYDMYNVATGEAFRVVPNKGVKIAERRFLISLDQAAREISNSNKEMGVQEKERISSLVDKADNESAVRELNREC